MILRLAVFFFVFSFLLSGLNYLLLKRSLRLSKNGNRKLFITFLTLACFIFISSFWYRYRAPNPESFLSNAVQWTHYSIVGLLAMSLIIYGTLEIIQLLTKPFDPKKRIFLTESVSKGVFLGTTLATVGGFFDAKAGPEIHDVKIKLPTLPESFKGTVLAQISDVHIGPLLHQDFLDRVVNQVMSLNPDIILITGDLVDGTVEQIKHQMEPLKRLKAKEGIYFCTGNHEYYSGVNEWIIYLESIGIHVFKNSHLILSRSGTQGVEKILLGGVYDLKSASFGHVCSPELAAKTNENINCKILLSHNPHGVEAAAEAGFHLQLSGHTHAGQFMPLTFFMRLGMKYVEGLYQVNESTQLYINRGTGFWGPPNRLGKRSEITKITLV